jgi:hypothetical protein
LLSHLSGSDQESLTKALGPLEHLAASEPVASPAAAANGDASA